MLKKHPLMNGKRTLWLRVSLLVFLFTGNLSLNLASQNVIDSLQQVLETDISDKERVDIYNKIAKSQRFDSLFVATYTTKAIQLAQEINYPEGISEAYNNLGHSAKHWGDYHLAASFYSEALQTAQKAAYRLGEAKANYGLGLTRSRQGQFSEAHSYFTRAYEISTEIGDEILASFTIRYIGRNYASQADHAEALRHYQLALERLSALAVEPFYLGMCTLI